MTINEAIQRYTDNAEYERGHGNLQGCLEFKQLANWLKELRAYESGHKKPVKIIGRQYQAIGINASGFPDKITVATKDGKEAMYKFIGYKTDWEGGNV